MVQCLETELLKMGYIKSAQKFKNATIFTTCKNEQWHAIVLTDIIHSCVKSAYSALTLRKTISKSCHIPMDNIVLVLCGSKYDMKDYGKNTIAIDNITGEIRHKRISSLHTNVLQPILKYCKEKNYKYKMMDAETKMRNGCTGNAVWLPMLLILINLLIHFNLIFIGNESYSISVLSVFHNKEFYRLFTYIFVHANIGHILSNSIALLVIGKAYASRAGVLKFLIIYVCGGVLAGLSSLLYTAIFTERYAVTTVGASGAIFAILGAYFIECMMDKNLYGRKGDIIRYCVIAMILSSIGTNIDIACHVGGFVAGVIVSYLLSMFYELIECEKYIWYAKKSKRREKLHEEKNFNSSVSSNDGYGIGCL